jgi:hypothetical protein
VSGQRRWGGLGQRRCRSGVPERWMAAIIASSPRSSGFWGNAPVVQRRSRGGNGLGHSAQESSRLKRFEAPVFGTSRKYFDCGANAAESNGGMLIGDGAAAQLLDAGNATCYEWASSARYRRLVEASRILDRPAQLRHACGYQRPTRQPPSHRHPLARLPASSVALS